MKGNFLKGLPFIYLQYHHISMKKKTFVIISLLCIYTFNVFAQDKKLKDAVNTLKERITIEGYAQLGYTYDDSGTEKTNTFEIKRAILMARGKITDRWSCYFMYSFANTGKILEAYTEYKLLPGLTVRLGEFKTMFSIENPMSPCYVELINSYSQATNYLVGCDSSDPLYGSNSGRDIGLLIYGNILKNLFTYHLAVMNGQGINKKDGNNNKDIVGSLMTHPTSWLSVGGSFIKGKGCAVGTSTINPDIAIGDNYTRNRWSAGATVKLQPVDIRTEYLHGKDGTVRSDGYYMTISAHVLPQIDVIASYDYFNKNKRLAEKQTNYVVGLQWWFYPKCRLQLQYTYQSPKNTDPSNLLQTQIQVRF